MIQQEEVKDLFHYKNGSLYWRNNTGTATKAGSKAGYLHKTGYVNISIKGKKYIEGDYYQFSRPDENSYLIVKFDYVCKQEVGREVVTKDFLVQGIVDSID